RGGTFPLHRGRVLRPGSGAALGARPEGVSAHRQPLRPGTRELVGRPRRAAGPRGPPAPDLEAPTPIACLCQAGSGNETRAPRALRGPGGRSEGGRPRGSGRHRVVGRLRKVRPNESKRGRWPAELAELAQAPLTGRDARLGRELVLHHACQASELVHAAGSKARVMIVEEDEGPFDRVGGSVQLLVPFPHLGGLVPLRLLELVEFALAVYLEVDGVRGDGRWTFPVLLRLTHHRV